MSARMYKCPYCNERYQRAKLVNHINKKHAELIPEDYTATRVVFNTINKRECGYCRVCHKETKWNETAGRYDVLCDDPKCKEELRRRYKENMLRVRGTYNILNDPEQQTKMLANRKISGKYKFTDGGVLTYTGSYEKKCLEFMDKVLEIPSKDILAPGPTLEYEMNGEKHFYITDFYLIPQNLIIEVKDGGDNLNTKDTPGMRSSRERTLAKEKLITESGEYNYIRLTNNNFAQLIDVLMEIKKAQFDKIDGKIIKVNESYVTENNIINNKDLEFNLDKWKPGNKNILFITGLSGSGKSTKAAKLAKEYNAVNIELDLFEHNYVVFDKNVTNDEGNLIVKEYFENKFGGAKKFKQGDKQLPHMMYDFIKYCMNYAYKHKDKLFIIEGIQLSDLEMANEIKDYPIIIVRTSIINSIYRAAKREGIKNYIKSFESYKDFLDLYKWYLSMDKNNKKFAKELEESYITEGIIDNYRFLDVKKDKSEVLKYLKKSNISYAEDIIENYIGEIIIDKDKMIGRIFVGNKKDKGFIVDLEISKAYRLQKLGNKLIDDAIKKYNGIDLLVDKDNEIALSMYKKRGFVIVKEIKNQYYMKLKSKLTKDDKVVNESVVNEVFRGTPMKSDLDPNFIPKDKFYLNDFAKKKIDKVFLNKYKNKYKTLKHVDPKNNGYVWMDDNKVVGYCSVDRDKELPWITALEVTKEYKGHGLGEQLLDYAVNELGGQALTVAKDNMIAKRMYDNYGFKVSKTSQEKADAGESAALFMYLDPSKSYLVENININESSSITLYHLSSNNLDGKTILPSIPDNYFTKNGYEDNKTKRVCFSTSIDGCLRGLSQNLTGKEFYVHIPIDNFDCYKPSTKEVPDSKITGEVWIKNTVQVKCIGKIRVTGDTGDDGLPFKYGNHIAELYDWNFEWIDKYNITNESYITESSNITLYHGSVELYSTLKSTGIDLGNAFQKPGWSLFTWTKYDSAVGWAIFCVLKRLNREYDIQIEGCLNSQNTVIPISSYNKLVNIIDDIDPKLKTYYVYTIKPDNSYEFGLGHSSNTPNCITIRNCNIKPYRTEKRILTLDDVNRYCKIVSDDYIPTGREYGKNGRLLSFLMKYDFMYNGKVKKQLSKDVDAGLLNVGDDIVAYINNNNIQVNKVTLLDRVKSIIANESYITESSNITLYHGTDNPNFDIIEPNSYNVGTRTSKPRMSSYWFDNAEYAKIFATMTILDNNLPKDKNGRVCLDNDMSILVINKYMQDAINLIKNNSGYIYYRSIDKSIVSRGHARYFPEYTIDVPVKPDGIIEVKYKDMIDCIKFVDQEYYNEVMHKYDTDSIRYDASILQQLFDIITKRPTGDVNKIRRKLKQFAKLNSLGESVKDLSKEDIDYFNNYIV